MTEHCDAAVVQRHLLGLELVVPVPLRSDYETLVHLARSGLVTQRHVETVEVALALLGYAEPGPAKLEVQRVGEVEVGVRMAQHRELAEVAPRRAAVVAQIAEAI